MDWPIARKLFFYLYIFSRLSIYAYILFQMGGSESKTSITALSEQVNNICTNIAQTCETVSTQNQHSTVNNTGIKLFGSYTYEQRTEIRADCFNDAKKQTQLQNDIISAISQASSASNVALLGAFSSSKSSAEVNLTNIIRNNVTMNNIQKSYTSITQDQDVNFGNDGIIVFEQAKLSQGSQIFAAATLQVMDKAGIFNKIANHIDQKSSATQENPLDFIAKAIGAISASAFSTILFFVFIICIFVGGIAFLFKMLGGNVSTVGNAARMTPMGRAVSVAQR